MGRKDTFVMIFGRPSIKKMRFLLDFKKYNATFIHEWRENRILLLMYVAEGGDHVSDEISSDD